jgi:RND family efflux transporter MFP subunit
MRFNVVVAAIAFAVLAASCKREAPPPARADSTAPAAIGGATVPFVKVVSRPLPPTLEVSGTLVADETSEVAAQAAGVVSKVEVDVGSHVKKGDPLVRLDGRDAELRVVQAQAASAQALARIGLPPDAKFDPLQVAEVRAAKEAMDLAVADADRTKRLFDAGGVSASVWDQARTRAEQTRAQYDAAKNGATQAQAAYESAQAQLRLAQKAVGDMVIRAPFDGGIVERRISAGEYANVGRVVVVVVHDAVLRLKMDIAEGDLSKIGLGKEVELSVAAYPGRTFKGVIKRIGASVKSQSRSLPVEADVPNEEGVLRAGLFARARIVLPGADAPALLVPPSAVGTTGTTSRVFVRSQNHVIERLVTVGRPVGDLVEIQGPLAAGDEVAVGGLDKLSDGAEISPAS